MTKLKTFRGYCQSSGANLQEERRFNSKTKKFLENFLKKRLPPIDISKNVVRIDS